MGGNFNDLYQQHVGGDLVNHSPLKPEPGGTMTLPLARQGFVVKPFDRSQTRRTRKASDVFPFFVAFQHLDRNIARQLFVDPTVLLDSPHAILWIYLIWYVNGQFVGDENMCRLG
jgi:hypothetical protein